MKRILKIFAMGLVFGTLLLIVQRALGIPQDVFLQYYWVFGTVVIVSAVLYNHLYIGRYVKKMKSAAALLNAGRIDDYIETVGQLRHKAKGRYLKNLFTVNLSVGYCDRGEYDQAIELLESLWGARLYGVVKMVHRLNLCGCYFYADQADKAMALYQKSQREFRLYRKTKLYGGNIAVLAIFAAIYNNELSHAAQLLKSAREAWDHPRLQDDYRYLEEKLQQELGEEVQ